jgi:hypothetical protein
MKTELEEEMMKGGEEGRSYQGPTHAVSKCRNISYVNVRNVLYQYASHGASNASQAI